MYCRNCGKQLFEGKPYCGYCGEKAFMNVNDTLPNDAGNNIISNNANNQLIYNNLGVNKTRHTKRRKVLAIVFSSVGLLLTLIFISDVSRAINKYKTNKYKYGQLIQTTG